MFTLRRASAAAIAAVSIFGGVAIAGCSERTEQAADNAAASAGNAVEGAAQDTARNTERAGQAVAEGAQEAGQAVTEGAREAGQAVAEGAREAGQTVAQGAERAVEGAADAGAAATMTAKVKNALIADEKISGYNLNVDTLADQKKVVITGTAPTEAEKKRVTSVTTKILQGSGYTLQNNVKTR